MGDFRGRSLPSDNGQSRGGRSLTPKRQLSDLSEDVNKVERNKRSKTPDVAKGQITQMAVDIGSPTETIQTMNFLQSMETKYGGAYFQESNDNIPQIQVDSPKHEQQLFREKPSEKLWAKLEKNGKSLISDEVDSLSVSNKKFINEIKKNAVDIGKLDDLVKKMEVLTLHSPIIEQSLPSGTQLDDLVEMMKSLVLHDQNPVAGQSLLPDTHRVPGQESYLQMNTNQDSEITKEPAENSQGPGAGLRSLRLKIRILKQFEKLGQNLRDLPTQDLQTILDGIEQDKKAVDCLVTAAECYKQTFIHDFEQLKNQYQHFVTDAEEMYQSLDTLDKYTDQLVSLNAFGKTVILDDFDKMIPTELEEPIRDCRQKWLENNQKYQTELDAWRDLGKNDHEIQQMTVSYLERDDSYDQNYTEITEHIPKPYAYEADSNIKNIVEQYNNRLDQLGNQHSDLMAKNDDIVVQSLTIDCSLEGFFASTMLYSDHLAKMDSKLKQGVNLLPEDSELKKAKKYRDLLEEVRQGEYERLLKNCIELVHIAESFDEEMEKWMIPIEFYHTEKMLHDQYRLVDKIGEGGFGVVYKAEDTLLNNAPRAIKEMRAQGRSPQEIHQAKEALERECCILTQLQHPHLPHISQYFKEGDSDYLVMELIEGQTLEDYLANAHGGKLPLHEVIEIGSQLCDVLDYLHTRESPIIFRDLKPANVMRKPNGHLYLIDFGTARRFKLGKRRDTLVLGSKGYAAPEQDGRQQTTSSADIYSLGATLHHLLSGDKPRGVFGFSPLDLSQYGLVGSQVAELIEQMIDIDEKKRPSSKAIQERLQELKDNIPQQKEVTQTTMSSTSEILTTTRNQPTNSWDKHNLELEIPDDIE